MITREKAILSCAKCDEKITATGEATDDVLRTHGASRGWKVLSTWAFDDKKDHIDLCANCVKRIIEPTAGELI